MELRVYDDDSEINDTVYVTKITEYPESPQDNSIEVSNKTISTSSVSFQSILDRIVNTVSMVDQKKAIYEKADAISATG